MSSGKPSAHILCVYRPNDVVIGGKSGIESPSAFSLLRSRSQACIPVCYPLNSRAGPWRLSVFNLSMTAPFEELPNEVLFNIFLFVPPSTVCLLQQVSQRFNGLSQPLLWRHYCRTLCKYWSPTRQMREKFEGDVNKFDWKKTFSERHLLARQVDRGIDDILSEQKSRLRKAELIVSNGYEAKDALLRNLKVQNCADDVLARQFYSDAVLGSLHRNMAIQEWAKLSEGQQIPLERALAGFDLFVLHGREGDPNEISHILDTIAGRFRHDVQSHADMNTRSKAVAVAEYLRARNLIGIQGSVDENYHNMQNNFLGIALQDPTHPSLPLISVAIYCCVAQRIGLNARPCGFPFHVLAIVKSPTSLDAAGQETLEEIRGAIYMDPFRSTSETDVESLKSQLMSLGIAPNEHADYLGPSSTAEIVRRSAKNIITSVQTLPRSNGADHPSPVECFPEVDGAFYASLWALTILADGNDNAAHSQRAQFLPYIVQRVESHFPMDLSLIEQFIAPLFSNSAQYNELLKTIKAMRDGDNSAPQEVKMRTLGKTDGVRFGIGQHFQHKRYNYVAVITGWDIECLAGDAWISRMGVSQLSRGKHQSFYHVK